MDHILLVEDSPTMGQLVKNKIESELNLPVYWTKTLAETTDLLSTQQKEFTIAILDFTLPDSHQGEILDVALQYSLPAIVFTSSFDEKVRELIWSKKVTDYIAKNDPNSLDYLIGTIKRLLCNPQTKILVVDDSPFFIKFLSGLLSVQQFQILTATRGKEALTILDEHPDIKLVLVDFNMPLMEGDVLCQEIRRKYKKEDMAIIGISAAGDKTMAARFIKAGANDFIVKKSFIVEEFYCRINQCLENIDLIQLTREAAIKDFLTGLYNRRYFFDAGRKLLASAKRKDISLACAMIDIDFFKKVNDQHGHDIGDQVLQHVATLLETRMRQSDIVARFGGEEFCILAVNLQRPDAEHVFDDLRQYIQDTPFSLHGGQEELQITVSIGVHTETEANLDGMIVEADTALYRAKEKGRNRVAFSAS